MNFKMILIALFTLSAAGVQAKIAIKKSITSPKVTLEMKTSDGHPIEDVALTGMITYSVITMKDCTGFICIPSVPHRVSRSGGGEVLGHTDEDGTLTIAPDKWKAQDATAKDLYLSYFTNGTVDVNCGIDADGDGDEDGAQVGFVDTLPQWQGDQLTTRTAECTKQTYSAKDAGKEVKISCVSPLTKAELEAKISELKAKCK